jgi:hypothetical protein
MADLVPHPLVTSVALKLAENGVGTLKKDALALLRKATGNGRLTVTGATAARFETAAATATDDSQHVAEKNALATAFADQATLDALSLFAGFLGGPVRHEGKDWRLLYLDSRLDSWMLVPAEAIIVSQRLDDDNAPSGKRDVLWVDATANLLRGSGPRTNDGRFLVGDLTQAGDFAASTGGGTFSAATGLLCEATTPGCCLSKRTRG